MYDEFGPPQFTGIVGRRFEPQFEPDWGTWTIVDRECGRLHACENEASARAEAEALEMVRGIVRDVAHSFSPEAHLLTS